MRCVSDQSGLLGCAGPSTFNKTYHIFKEMSLITVVGIYKQQFFDLVNS